jgi:hypothetical protein
MAEQPTAHDPTPEPRLQPKHHRRRLAEDGPGDETPRLTRAEIEDEPASTRHGRANDDTVSNEEHLLRLGGGHRPSEANAVVVPSDAVVGSQRDCCAPGRSRADEGSDHHHEQDNTTHSRLY